MVKQMDIHKKIREHISALGDGELSTSDLELALAALRGADGEQTWSVYHRIGDVLRAQASPDLTGDFNERLSARLMAEPTHAGQAAPCETADLADLAESGDPAINAAFAQATLSAKKVASAS
jgi:sigma-E factor negative regulatory protein RseA